MTLKLPYAEHVQIGMKLKPINRVQLNVDANWSNWERLGIFQIVSCTRQLIQSGRNVSENAISLLERS